MLKKILVIFLFLVFWFSTIGYFHAFMLKQMEIRHSVQSRIEKGLPEEELLLLTFSSQGEIKWIKKDKEFLYQGHMYDVVSMVEEDGKLHVRCYDDKKEARLASGLKMILKKDDSHDRNATRSNTVNTFSFHYPSLFFHYNSSEFYTKGKISLIKEGYSLQLLDGHPRDLVLPPVLS